MSSNTANGASSAEATATPSTTTTKPVDTAGGIDTSGKTTAEILKAFIIAGKIPTHEQTIKDFGFDRTHSENDSLQLLDVYRHVMVTTLDVAPATLQTWMSEDKKVLLQNMMSTLREALNTGISNPEDVNRLKDSFRWLTRNRYIWDPAHSNAETRAIFNAAAAKPLDGNPLEALKQLNTMFDGMVKVHKDKEAREARGEPANAEGDHDRTSCHTLRAADGRPILPMMYCPGMDLKSLAAELEDQKKARGGEPVFQNITLNHPVPGQPGVTKAVTHKVQIETVSSEEMFGDIKKMRAGGSSRGTAGAPDEEKEEYPTDEEVERLIQQMVGGMKDEEE